MDNRAKGDKYSQSGKNSAENLGLIEQSSFDKGAKLRSDTLGDKPGSPRPTATDKTINSDRGTFTDKC